jgi:hypothetical protein
VSQPSLPHVLQDRSEQPMSMEGSLCFAAADREFLDLHSFSTLTLSPSSHFAHPYAHHLYAPPHRLPLFAHRLIFNTTLCDATARRVKHHVSSPTRLNSANVQYDRRRDSAGRQRYALFVPSLGWTRPVRACTLLTRVRRIRARNVRNVTPRA